MPVPITPRLNESNLPKLPTAVIIGDTTHSRTKIWVRTYLTGDWWLVLTEKPIPLTKFDLVRLDEKPVKAYLDTAGVDYAKAKMITIGPETDRTGVFEFNGLKPGTRYYYYLIAESTDTKDMSHRTERGYEESNSFRTLAEKPTEVRFGFYSCHDPFSVKGHSEGLWDDFCRLLLRRDADFVIGGGDQVYVDTNRDEDMPDLWRWIRKHKPEIVKRHSTGGVLQQEAVTKFFVEIYHQYYRFYWNFPNLLKTYGAFPQYMMWDDHEIMDGWGSLTQDERNKRLNVLLRDDDNAINEQLVACIFQAAVTAYHHYQHSHNPTTAGGPDDPDTAVWDYSIQRGPFAFYVLDMRGHHDIENPEGERLLGAAQMSRFLGWLGSQAVKRAKVLFIGSPVPVVHWNEKMVNIGDVAGAKDDFCDEWGHKSNRAERNKLLDAVLEASHQRHGQKVVFLSGDVHSMSAFRLTQSEKYPDGRVYNITSSAISRHPAPGFMKIGIAKDGPLDGYTDGRIEKLYQQTGCNNFSFLHARLDDDGKAHVSVELYHTGGDTPGEIVVKHLDL